jgi:hypothetical protein
MRALAWEVFWIGASPATAVFAVSGVCMADEGRPLAKDINSAILHRFVKVFFLIVPFNVG